MRVDPITIDYYWNVSSLIRHVEPLPLSGACRNFSKPEVERTLLDRPLSAALNAVPAREL